MEKQAGLQDWLVNRGNQYVTKNFDSMLLDPEQRRQLFDQASGVEQPRSWLSYLNPMSYARRAYAADPRSKQHFTKLFQQRLKDPKFVQRLFGGQKSTVQAAGEALGPTGLGGLAGLGVGAGAAMTGHRGVGLLAGLTGLGGLAHRAAQQHRFMTDPQSWAAAFGSNADPEARSRLHSLSTLYSAMPSGPKQAAVSLDIEKGDVLLGGRFKNIPMTVEEFGEDENGQPTVNGRKLLAYRIKKLMPAKQAKDSSEIEIGGLRFQREADGTVRLIRPMAKEPEKEQPLTTRQRIQQLLRENVEAPAVPRLSNKADLLLALGLRAAPDNIAWQGRPLVKTSGFTASGSRLSSASTSFNPQDHTEPVNRLLQEHFPIRATRNAILTDPNISMLDKAKILGSIRSAAGGKTTGTASFGQLLPSLIGAGVGYVGAGLVSSMLSLPPTQSRAFRVGSAILGGVLNNPRMVQL